MNLNPGQETALQTIRDLQKNHPEGGRVLVISGAAGTGKSTLIARLAEEIGPEFMCLAPTGKAALRVRNISGGNAKTIHSWMFSPKEDPQTGEVSFVLKDFETVELPEYGFVTVDEASMLGLDVFRELFGYCRSMGLNLVLVGDGHQLPPVDRRGVAFSVFAPEFPAHHRVELTEIHRQALESPLIRICTRLRDAQWVDEVLADLPSLTYAEGVREAQRLWEEGDGVTICHRNATRLQLNADIRKAIGHPKDVLVADEPLLVTQNNYMLEVYNGEVIPFRSPEKFVSGLAASDPKTQGSVLTDIWRHKVTGGAVDALVASREVLGTLGTVAPFFVRCAVQREVRRAYPELTKFKCPAYLNANLGYSLTAHKSQGSEWEQGLVVVEPSLNLGTTDGRRWAYTAVSRFKVGVKLVWMSS